MKTVIATNPTPRSIETLSPFRRSAEKRTAIPARITGEIPDWLRGEVLRTCPAVFETNGWRAEHWFDGLGMIYAFRIGDTGISFQSRLLDSAAARDAARGEADSASFGTPSTRSLMRRIADPVPRPNDNTNVNIVKMGGDLVALTESDRQLVIDRDTLASTGTVAYEEDALGRAVMPAHPHFDFERGRVVSTATQFGAQGTISVYEHAPASRRREIVGAWRTDHVPYIHGFGLTPKHAILVAHPFDVRPMSLLFSKKGYIDHFDWRPEEGTRLVAIDRATGATREHVTDPFFMFHTVNAFERGAETVLDLLAYPDAGIVASLGVDRMAAQLPELRPSLMRIVMRPGVERASIEKLSEARFEFPSTNYRAVNGRPYRFAWGASDGPWQGGYASAIVKADVQTGASASFSDGRHIFGEPLFVSRPQDGGEDDGVLLSVGSAMDAETSILAVIDAKTMALVASAEVPGAIPLGFHGSFVRGEG